MVIVFSSGPAGQAEALIVKGILDANEVPCRLAEVGNLPGQYRAYVGFEVQVPEQFAAEARRAISDAKAAGPAAADEAESATERWRIA
jgi:hypothetical protein